MPGDSTSSDLLAPGDPEPFMLLNASGACPLVLACDHASNRVPEKLVNLGLGPGELASHIAWDPGAALVAKALSSKLDAALVMSAYSRLVIDCNRPLASPQLIAERSDNVVVPGNRALPDIERAARIREVYRPYHDAVGDLLRRRTDPKLLLSIHTFTPQFNGEPRPWHVGVAWYRDSRFASALFTALSAHGDLVVGYNQPYAIETDFDYTIPVHGEGQGLPSAMVEIRQDCVEGVADVEQWANRLAQGLRYALASLAIHI